MLHRLLLTLLTLFFPPLTVLLLTGPYTDTLLNSILFLCGVIPSHIHAFYISCTYFHRKRKVRKGRWPGPPKTLIFDRKVWYGGAEGWEVEELRLGERVGKKSESGGTSPSLDDCGARRGDNQRKKRTSGVVNDGRAVLPARRPSARSSWGKGDEQHRRGEVGSSVYDRRSRNSFAGHDRQSQMSDGLDRRRSVLGEVQRRY